MSTTVTGKLENLGEVAVSIGTFVRFYLRGTGGNQPRVDGTAIIAPTLGAVYYFDFVPNVSGVISGTLWSTRDSTGLLGGDIEVGGVTTACWYGMVVFQNGKAGPETPIHAKNTATIDISNITPLSTSPVVTAPTGDSTYARLDGGNMPFTGTIQGVSETLTTSLTLPKFDNIVFIDGSKYACTDVGLNAAITDVSNGASGATSLVDARGCGGMTWNNTITIGPSNGITVWLGTGTFTCTSTAGAACINQNSEGGGLLGNGPFATRIRINNAAGDGVKVSQQFTYMKDLTIDSLVTRTGSPSAGTAGGGIHVLGGLGTYNNIRLERTGVGILLDTAASGFTSNNAFNDIRMGTGGFATGNWIDYIYIGSNDNLGNVSDSHFHHLIISMDLLAPTTAAIELNSCADSAEFVSPSIGKGTTTSANIFLIRNTLTCGASPTFPRIVNGYFEAGTTGNCFEILAVQDLSIVNSYCASSSRGIHLNGAGTVIKGVTWIGGIFENIQNEAVLMEAGQTNVGFILSGARVSDASQVGNGSKNAISIGAGSTDFVLRDNDCTSVKGFANQPFNCISIAAGATDSYTVVGNNLSNLGMTDGGTGANKTVGPNYPLTPTADNFPIGLIDFMERAAPAAGVAGRDRCYGDSTSHGIKCSFNNGSFAQLISVGNTGLGTPVNLTGQVANLGATTIYTTNSANPGIGGAGLYRVCVALWPTVTGNTTALQANAIAPSGAGTVTIADGTVLNTAALTNGGGGCTMVHAAASSAIQVSTTGYNTTGTYSIQATVEQVF